MRKLITATDIQGVIEAPASKSITQRAIIAAMLAKGETTLNHLTLCDDTEAALNIAKSVGCHIEQDQMSYHIKSAGAGRLTFPKDIFCGESGLLTRIMIPVSMLDRSPKRITGCGTLLVRPLDTLFSPLSKLGVTIHSGQRHLPLSIKGLLKGGEIHLDGSLSSQFLTGLLMALPLVSEDSIIHVENLKSKPYIDLTLDLLSTFGIDIQKESDSLFKIKGGQTYRPCTYTIEGDWSGASCLLVAGAIAGEITINGLNIHSKQADTAILTALDKAGIPVQIKPTPTYDSISVHQSPVKPFDFDATQSPDLFPALTVLAACAEGTSTIKGVHRLRHKESNRALTLIEEFQKIGIQISINNDTLTVTGGKISGPTTLQSHQDHRIAMALATVALRAKDNLQIEGEHSVTKSFPEFWNTLDQLAKK